MKKIGLVFCVAAGLMFGLCGVSHATPIWTPQVAFVAHLSDDALLSYLLADSAFSFMAEGRIGDPADNATFELDLGQSTSAPVTTADYAWSNGTPTDFCLFYSPWDNQVIYAVGDSVLTYTPTGSISDIFIRTQAVNADTSILVTDLAINGVSIGHSSIADGSANGLDILWIGGLNLTNGFMLTGTSTMNWSSTQPRDSQLAYQIKVGEVQVPEPGTMLLMVGALLTGQAMRRKAH